MADEDDDNAQPGSDLVNAISGAVTGKNVLDSVRNAWKTITGHLSGDDTEREEMIKQMNKKSNDDRVKRANEGFIEQKAAEAAKTPKPLPQTKLSSPKSPLSDNKQLGSRKTTPKTTVGKRRMAKTY